MVPADDHSARIAALFERSINALLAVAEDPAAPARERRLAATTVLNSISPSLREGAGGRVRVASNQPARSARSDDSSSAAPGISPSPRHSAPAASAVRPPLPLPAGEGRGEGVTTSRRQPKTTLADNACAVTAAPTVVTPISAPSPVSASPSPSHRITPSPSHPPSNTATSESPATAGASPRRQSQRPSLLSGFRDLYREVFPTAPLPGRHTDKHPRDG